VCARSHFNLEKKASQECPFPCPRSLTDAGGGGGRLEEERLRLRAPTGLVADLQAHAVQRAGPQALDVVPVDGSALLLAGVHFRRAEGAVSRAGRRRRRVLKQEGRREKSENPLFGRSLIKIGRSSDDDAKEENDG